MAADIDVSGFSRDRYFARAWRLMTQEKGWWKPILLMCVALLVPIAGPLAVLGYQLEWARLLAWDVNDPMRRRGIRIGGLIVSGWRGFLAILGWGIAYVLIDSRISEVPGIGGVLDLAWKFCGIFITMMIMVAAIRATIYQNAGAGYNVKNLWEMARRDLGGLARVWVIGFTATVIEAVVSAVILSVGLVSMIASIAYDVNILYTCGSTMPIRELVYYVLDLIDIVFNGLWPSLFVLSIITLVLSTVTVTLTFAALALWMRQFDLPSWGKSSDPLPASVVESEAKKGEGVPAAPALPVAPEQAAPAQVAQAVAEKDEDEPESDVEEALDDDVEPSGDEGAGEKDETGETGDEEVSEPDESSPAGI